MGLIALLAVLAFFANTSADYVGSEACGASGCHKGNYEALGDTLHGIDFSDWDYHGTPTNKYTMYSSDAANITFGSCAPCHVVGWNDADNSGTKEAEPWNSTHNLPLGSIGCENCHGPGGDHVDDRSGNPEYMVMGEFQYSLSCAGWATTSNTERPGADYGGESITMCHDGGRMGGIPDDEIPGYYDSGHVSGVPAFVQGNADCYHCMASSGFIEVTIDGNVVEEVPDDAVYGIYCGACHDPHPEEEGEHFQLRAPEDEICELCHYNTHEFPDTHVRHPTTEFRNGLNGKDVPVIEYMPDVSCPECHMYGTGHRAEVIIVGHSFDVVPQACVDCHSMYTNETAEAYIDTIQSQYDDLVTPFGNATTGLIGEVEAQKEYAIANGLWTDDINMTYLEGMWNYEYPHQDGSHGAHNPDFMVAMFSSARMKFEEVLEDTAMGNVTGDIKWKDGDAIEGAKIMDSAGVTIATTDADGAYQFFYDEGTWTFFVNDADGKAVGTINSVAVTTMQDTSVGTTEFEKSVGEGDDEDTDSMTYVFIGIIIVLIIILIAMAMMGNKPEE